MVSSVIRIALDPNYVPVWQGQPPEDFATDFAELQTAYIAVQVKAALVEKASGGASDLKAVAETNLEDSTHVLARALANHFKKTGDLDNRAKVDVSKSAIQKLKAQDLVAKCTQIRDLGTVVVAQPKAVQRGVTAARITAVTDALPLFTAVMNAPRGQIINRSTLLKEIETDTADLLEQLADLDDLVLQFDSTDLGLRFIAAWKQARIIVDVGHSAPHPPEPTPAPANTTATATASAAPAAKATK
jgi:hypothetical protein